MTYPLEEDIKEHQNRLWALLLQHYMGNTPLDYALHQFRGLMGITALYAKKLGKEVDLEKVKEEIAKIDIIINS